MNTETYDVTVVGAGIIGRFTAWKIIQSGRRTLLIDQFSLPNSHGSSKGLSRGVQVSTGFEETEGLKQMKDFSIKEWWKLQKKTSQTITRPSKLLHIGPSEQQYMINTQSSLRKYSQHSLTSFISFPSLRQQFPEINLPENYVGILDDSRISLAADEILKYLSEEFTRQGGIVRTGTVTDVTPGEIIKVHTSDNLYNTRKVVIATGPWSNPLLKCLGLDIHLTTTHAMFGYWKVAHDLLDNDDTNALPNVVEWSDIDETVRWSNYTTENGPCVKVVMSGKTDIDPQSFSSLDDANLRLRMEKYIKERFNHLDDSPLLVENCIYTFSPDNKAIIGCHPKWENVVLGVAMSGYGFGFSPAISEILCDLVCDRKPKFDISEFMVNRF